MGSGGCGPAGDFADLAIHALAWVQTEDASGIRDPRYLRWVRDVLPREAWAAFDEDAAVVSALFARAEGRRALHALPRLHHSITAFLASASRPIEQLGERDVADAAVLRALRRMDRALVEIVRAGMALSARAYARARAQWVEPEVMRGCEAVAPWLAEAARVWPSFAQARVELAHALGPHGRGFGARIVVGAPAGWNAMAPARCAVQALHEHAVEEAGGAIEEGAGEDERYARSEWGALVEVAKRMEGADTGLREAHALWVEDLALGGLAREAVRLGIAREDEARAVLEAGHERARVLAAVGTATRR